MSDYGDMCKDLRETRREARAKFGVPCPECVAKLPKAEPSRLLPGQKCKIHGYRDPRTGPEEARYLTEAARRFFGVGELERTGYIPAGSADEREAKP